MEIVIENPTESQSMIKSNVNAGYGGYQGGHRPYYSTLPPRRTQHMQKQADFDPTVSSVRRVDKSGLLEISETDLPRRTRHLTGAENLSGTLTRRIDRTGLLEAVPEVPDQIQARTPQSSPTITERHLTGAENDHRDQKHNLLSPRLTQSSSDSLCQTDNSVGANSPKVSSPYFRRQVSPNPINNTDVIGGDNFLPIDSQRNNRQSYIDLTGATYTKGRNNSPLMIGRVTASIDGSNNDDKQTPDCLSRLSPRLRNDRQSPMTVSCIPDVIEAHGSKKCDDGGKATPEGERAEAEGCEHTAIESLEETRVSFKAPNKILHNDNIQTLRVIILSEQL